MFLFGVVGVIVLGEPPGCADVNDVDRLFTDKSSDPVCLTSFWLDGCCPMACSQPPAPLLSTQSWINSKKLEMRWNHGEFAASYSRELINFQENYLVQVLHFEISVLSPKTSTMLTCTFSNLFKIIPRTLTMSLILQNIKVDWETQICCYREYIRLHNELFCRNYIILEKKSSWKARGLLPQVTNTLRI